MWTIVAIIIGIGIVVYFVAGTSATPATPVNTASQTGIRAMFTCDGGMTADATFFQGTTTAAASAGQPPIPGGSVHLVLSDSRVLTLPQTISADGARYANANESFVFWNVGDTATITENGTTTYANCVDRNNQ